MSLSKNALNALIAGAFAFTMAGASHDAFAKSKSAQEKCYGIAKAGKNDCAAADKSHVCAAHATMDSGASDFLLLPKGVCAKIVGASMSAPTAADDKMMDKK